MKISKLLLISVSCLLTVPAVWGQAANGQAESGQARAGILGYLNPSTRTFHPLAKPIENLAEPPATATFTGTVKLTITITVKSAGITNVNCFAFMDVEDGASLGAPRSFSEADVVAASGTGTTRTCTLSVPYSWALATQSTDTMSTSYEVGNILFSPTAPPKRNSLLSPVDKRKVPANGTITTLTANVTI